MKCDLNIWHIMYTGDGIRTDDRSVSTIAGWLVYCLKDTYCLLIYSQSINPVSYYIRSWVHHQLCGAYWWSWLTVDLGSDTANTLSINVECIKDVISFRISWKNYNLPWVFHGDSVARRRETGWWALAQLSKYTQVWSRHLIDR